MLLAFQRDGATVCLVQDGESPIGLVTIEDLVEQVVGRFEDEYPRRPKLTLREMVVTDAGLLHLSARTCDAAIAELAARVPAGRVPAGVDVAAQAIAREREMPTDLGVGVAVPHARCRGLTEPIVVFGRSADGIVFDRTSASLVHLVFLLLTPDDQPNLQVLLLSQVARVAGDAESRRRLLAAESPAEVREILTVADPEPGRPARAGGVS